MKKLFVTSVLALASIALVGCGTSNPTTAGETTLPNTTTQEDTTSGEGKEATLTGNYISPAKMSYSNMRPTYNYYLTTFTFETLETYSDNTYCLTISSTCFSAVILPEEGNDATANERDNYIARYYGAFVSEVDELDEDTVYFTLSEPSRIVMAYDSAYAVDTDNWTPAMREKSADKDIKYDPETGSQEVVGTKYYETGAEYLEAKKFAPVTLTTAKKNSALEFLDVFSKDNKPVANAPATKKTDIDKNLSNEFLSPAKMSYSNMRPTYNYYLTTFAYQDLKVFNDNTYCLTISSSCFSAVILPDEGNDATANERDNYLTKYYGTFTSEVDDLDEDTVYYTLSEPTRIVMAYDSSYYVDTANWTPEMKEKSADKDIKYDPETGSQEVVGTKYYETGAEYLEAKKFSGSKKFTTATSTNALEYLALSK